MHKRSLTCLFRPLRFTGRDGALLAVEQRLPRDLAEEGATFWADVINLELVSQRLQLHRDLGRLLGS